VTNGFFSNDLFLAQWGDYGRDMGPADPVCGMTIEEKDVFGTSPYKGAIYYFCSKECK
jgi:hypothetical protein